MHSVPRLEPGNQATLLWGQRGYNGRPDSYGIEAKCYNATSSKWFDCAGMWPEEVRFEP